MEPAEQPHVASKKQRLIPLVCLSVLLIAGVLAYYHTFGHTKKRWNPPQPVKLQGVSSCTNYSHFSFIWSSVKREDRVPAVTACDGDILVVSCETEKGREMFFPYRASDGPVLSLSSDGESRLLLDGKTISIDLSGPATASWEWLKEASDTDLSLLRFVIVDADMEPPWMAQCMAHLKRLAGVNPSVGLGIGDSVTLRRVLPLFEPKFLWLGEGSFELQEEDMQLISSERALETFWPTAVTFDDPGFLSKLPNLRNLMIGEFHPGKDSPPPTGWDTLESLVFMEPDTEDLSSIAHLSSLRELHLVCSRDLVDIGALSQLPDLKWLTLTGCEGIFDISVLDELKQLKCLSLPPNVSQEDFVNVIEKHPDLILLEMVGCENINDLSPLKNLRGLEGLVVVGKKPGLDHTPILEMRNLRYLALSEKAFEDLPGVIEELEEALPGCTIAIAEPFCMGSGWILILPLVMVPARLLYNRQRRKLAA